MAFRCIPAAKDPVAALAYRPWTLAVEPFQVCPNTWYVAGIRADLSRMLPDKDQ